MSIGGPQSFVFKNAIDYAFKKNCVLVAAMGNANTDAPSYPVGYNNVFAVGATDITDSRAYFSNYGPHIDVVAPGVNILSTVPNDTYASYNGTSMATPHVSGLAALLKSCNMNFSNTQIMDIIRKTARPLGPNPPNDEYGHGIIDVKAAIMKCPSIEEEPLWKRLCNRYPWLPWCRFCNLYPRICNAFLSSEGIPGEMSESFDMSDIKSLDSVEQELEEALHMLRKMKSNEDFKDKPSDKKDCCSESQ